jgi:hypothetical protein
LNSLSDKLGTSVIAIGKTGLSIGDIRCPDAIGKVSTFDGVVLILPSDESFLENPYFSTSKNDEKAEKGGDSDGRCCRYLKLHIGSGKRDHARDYWGKTIIPTCIDFYSSLAGPQPRLLLLCSTENREHSVCLTISLLLHFSRRTLLIGQLEGPQNMSNATSFGSACSEEDTAGNTWILPNVYSKKGVQLALLHVQQYYSSASPARRYLKEISTFFLMNKKDKIYS